MRGAFINNTSREAVFAYAADGADPRDTLATFIGGGYENSIVAASSNYNALGSSIMGGAYNKVKARFSCVSNGFGNEIYEDFSAIAAGYYNKIGTNWGSAQNRGANFIGAGKSNSIEGGVSQAILAGDNNTIDN